MKYSRELRQKKRNRNNLITNILLCIIALGALTGCIILLIQNYSMNHEVTEAMNQIDQLEQDKDLYIYTEEDAAGMVSEAASQAVDSARSSLLEEIKSQFSNGDSTAEILRQMYPDDLVVLADAKYNFFPIQDNLKKHSYDLNKFVIDDKKEITYQEDIDNILSYKTIDVSRYQGDIDWEKVAGDGVNYAFVRTGLRGYSEGKIIEDEYFKDNVKQATDNGVKVGAYFYTQAISEEEAIEEADFVIEALKGLQIDCPIVLDVEDPATTKARTNDLTKEERTQYVIAFLERVKDAGYEPMIYGNLKSFLVMLDMNQLENYEKWFAFYDEYVYFPYEFSIWQYSAAGTVDGIDGEVDLNISMKAW